MNIDISKIWPGWTITERLGHGGFGDDEILNLCHEEAERIMEEIKVMQKLKGSANIVSIEDSALS